MEKDYLILKRASAFRPSGEWNDDDFDVLADGAVVGRIFKSAAAPVGTLSKTAHRRTATLRRARPRWRRSRKAGGSSQRKAPGVCRGSK